MKNTQPQSSQQTASQLISQVGPGVKGSDSKSLMAPAKDRTASQNSNKASSSKQVHPHPILKQQNVEDSKVNSLAPTTKPAQRLSQTRHQSINMGNHPFGQLKGLGGNKGDSDALRKDINQTLQRTGTLKRASESLSSSFSNKIVPLQAQQNGRLSRATQGKTPAKNQNFKRQKSSDSNNQLGGSGNKKNDLNIQELIKQIEQKRKEINAIKGKQNPASASSNNLNGKLAGQGKENEKENRFNSLHHPNLDEKNAKKRSTVELQNSNRLTFAIHGGKNGGERSSSSSGSDNKNSNKKSGGRSRRKTVQDNKHKSKSKMTNEEFMKGFQLLDKKNHKKDQGILSPGKGKGAFAGASGKMLKIKAFIDEAKQEQIDFEKSSSESDNSHNSEGQNKTKREKRDRKDKKQGAPIATGSSETMRGKNQGEDGMGGGLTSRALLGLKENQPEDQEGQLTNRSNINDVMGDAGLNNASFVAGNLNNLGGNASVAGHTINSDNQDNSNAEEQNRSKQMNFSLLDDQMLKRKMPKFVINPTALWKTIWNVIGLLLILFLSITVPYRIPFEETTPDSWFYLDLVIDSIFLVDVAFNFFTAYEDENGELIVERSKIAKNYIKTWLSIDIASSIPISLIQKYSQASGVDNIKLLKLSRLPRLYRLLRLIKLMRLYKSNKFVEKLFAAVNISVTANRMITSLIMMIFLLHLIGCLWATVASLTFGAYPTIWMSPVNLVDAQNFDQYVASVYWAAVTIYTVGYGDITPQNEMEMMACVLILFTGVSLYAYMFSKLSTLFSSVNANDNKQKTRDEIIQELSLKHRFSNDLMNKIQYFFQQNSNLISLSKEYDIDELLEKLPAHLKSEISYFLYRDAIETIKILQDKDQRFYGDYLSKFEPMRIKNGTVFAKEGTSPQEVFFLLKGCVQCEKQEKYYLEGTIFGETDIILKRNRTESYVAKSDCFILKLEASIFEQILDEFEDIREEIQQIVVEREKKRIEDMQQQKLKKEDPKAELQRLMSKMNLDDMQAQKFQYLRHATNKSTKSDGFERLQSVQDQLANFERRGSAGKNRSQIQDQDEPQQYEQNIASDIQGQRQSLKNYANLHVDTGKNYGSLGAGASSVIEKRDSSLKGHLINQNSVGSKIGASMNTFGNNVEDSGYADSNQMVGGQISPKIKSKIEDIQGTQKLKQQVITPYVEKYTQQNQSPDFNYNKLLMFNKGGNKMDEHMQKIQNIKNNIRESMAFLGQEQQLDRNAIEERITETKNQIRMENQLKELEKIDDILGEEEEFGYDSHRQNANGDEFNNLLRTSLMKLQKTSEQEKIQRKATQKDRPTRAGNDMAQLVEEKQESVSEMNNPDSQQPQYQQFRAQNNYSAGADFQQTFDNFQQAASNIINFNTQNMTDGRATAIGGAPSTDLNNTLINNLNSNFNQTQIDSQRNAYTALDMASAKNVKGNNMIGANTTYQQDAQSADNQTLGLDTQGDPLDRSVNSYMMQNLELMEPYNPNNDPLLENDVQKLSQHIMSCLSSISNTRLLIMEYCSLFRTSIEQMGEDANEIIRQHYVQGVKCLESYLSIMNLIEKLIQSIDLQSISGKISLIQVKTNESEKRFYFLENRVKMLQEVLARKIKILEKQRARMLSKKPLVIVKRNPLLDKRDEQHLHFNQKLMGNEPNNM